MSKAYLGDGVYVNDVGYEVILTTSDGIIDTNTIHLEDSVLQVFIDWLEVQGILKPGELK